MTREHPRYRLLSAVNLTRCFNDCFKGDYGYESRRNSISERWALINGSKPTGEPCQLLLCDAKT